MSDDFGDDNDRVFRRTNAPSGGKVIQLDQIIGSLKDMQRSNFTKETEWLFEKSQMSSKITQLESQLQAQGNINEDLIRRIKMLEFCLREERIKYARLLQQRSGNGSGGDQKDGDAAINIIDSVLDKANLNANLYERIAKRRAKAQRPLLLKFLQEVGYEDIFNTNEINEIKELYNRAQADLTDSINQANSLHTQKLEEKLLADETVRNKLLKRSSDKDEDAAQETGANEATREIAPLGKELSKKYELKSHMDIVRGIQFVPSVDAMATISEDCMVKLWNLSEMDRKYAEASTAENLRMEPYMTLRGHTGPLLCSTSITDAARDTPNKNLLFTAGIEGIIRVWSIPQVSSITPYGNTQDGKNYCVAVWTDPEQEQEAIWSLKYHHFQDLMLSLNANDTIVLWNTAEIDQEASESENIATKALKRRYKFKNESSEEDDTQATACAWLFTEQDKFVVSYDSGLIAFFDSLSDNSSVTPHVYLTTPQINAIEAHPQRSLLCVGHENGSITLFDYSDQFLRKEPGSQGPGSAVGREIKKISAAHADAVTCMQIAADGLRLVTGGHDSSIKVWDLRHIDAPAGADDGEEAKATEPLLSLENVHEMKYDEGVQGLAMHPTQPFLASGGADSIIQIYELM